MEIEQSKISVLMFPWLAHGHISPFLELAKRLTQRNFHIYFCSTPINLYSIKRNLPEKYSNTIQLVELHLPSLPEFPPHYHTTKNLPPHLMSTLKEVMDMSSPNFFNILKILKPDLLLCDFLQPWAPKIASSLNIPSVTFPTNSALVVSAVLHSCKTPTNEFPFKEVNLHDSLMTKIIDALKSSSRNGFRDIDRIEQCLEQSRNVVLMKTFRELEGKYIDYLSTLLNKKIVPVGPLVQDPIDDEDSKALEIMNWLDNKRQSSTVFVSFGSEYFLSKEEREEVAHGLELSKVNFIWVVRFPVGENNINLEDALPTGFLERVKGRGLIVKIWAPQAKILKHCSIGGFVSHCGWSSIMESMKYGIPIIAMAKQLDQPLNAKLVEGVGVGLEVKRDKNGNFGREEIAEAIKEVVVEKRGGNIRSKARETSEHLKKKGEEETDEVVNELLKLIFCA